MQLDAEDLLEQMRQDWPLQYEVSQLRVLVRTQQDTIARLSSMTPTPPAFTGATRPYSVPSLDEEDGRHG